MPAMPAWYNMLHLYRPPRAYTRRYDYEGVDTAGAEALMTHLRARVEEFNAQATGKVMYSE